jgi:pimeloyl-ACP methyl ester carboxylesterase
VYVLIRASVVLSAVILSALAAGGCSKKVTIDNASDPRWILQHNPHAKTALVFVHGLFGDTVGSWTAANGMTFFKLIANDPTVGSALDIYAFGLRSAMFSSGSFDIQAAADRLDEYLTRDHVLPEYQEVVFVAHGMGGLVVVRELLSHQQLLERVPLLVLYSTPQTGAQIAALAHKVAENPALAELLPANKDDRYLKALSGAWKADGAVRPHVTCVYAERATNGALVVPSTGATDFCDEPYATVDADQISIVKPAGPRAQAVTVLVDALYNYAVGIQFLGKLETPDFIADGDHSVFNLGSPTSDTSTARLVNSGFRKLSYTISGIADPHALRISPDPRSTPREIEGTRSTNGVITDKNREQLQLSLLWGAGPADKYSFVLSSSDAMSPRTVWVNVDWATVGQQRSSEATYIVNNLSTLLAASERVVLWKAPATAARTANGFIRVDENATPATQAKAVSPDDVVDSVRKSILLANGELATATQWLMTADFLDAVNWSPLAVLALRRLELEAPSAVKSVNAEAVAASVSQRSGEKRVFAGAEPITSDLQSATPLALKDQILVSADLADASAELANRMQRVPWLRYYSLSLQGDLAWKRGHAAEARAAYQAAARLISTPSIAYRLQQVTEALHGQPSPVAR